MRKLDPRQFIRLASEAAPKINVNTNSNVNANVDVDAAPTDEPEVGGDAVGSV